MTQFENIVQFAKRENLIIHFDEHNIRNSMFVGMIGVETKDCRVYWYEYTENGYVNYHHAYNRRNGTKIRGYVIGYKFLQKMLY
jgi:hypothetical protein